MKNTYKIKNLDCANCAAKMETAIGKLDGIEKCTISFMTSKLNVETKNEPDKVLLDKMQKEVKRIHRKSAIV